jgi:hypothetical protein
MISAIGMTEGVTTIMDAEDGMRIEDLIITINIIRLGIPTGLTMIDHMTMGRIIAASPGGGRLIANDTCRKADRLFST